MNVEFSKIGLIGKYRDAGIADTLQAVNGYLLGRKLHVLLDADTAEGMPGHGMATATRGEIGERCDLAIVVGGDGTFLNAARSLAHHDISLLGLNMGHLGFLTDISPDEMQTKLDEIFAGRQGYAAPTAGFFLWLPVDDSEAATVKLWTETGVKVLRSFLESVSKAATEVQRPPRKKPAGGDS